MECIRQDDDCTLEIFNKVSVVAVSILSTASAGIFGKLEAVAKGLKTTVKCANSMIGVVRAIIRYVRNIKTSDPQTSQDKILALLYQTNNVVTDLPLAIYASYDDEIVSSWDIFVTFLKGANFTADTSEINDTEIATLSDALKSNLTCGYDLQSLTDRTWMTVAQLKMERPDITEDELRLEISNSELVVSNIATVTNNCMEQLIQESDITTAYSTRHDLRKTFSVIIDDFISTGTSDNGSLLTVEEYAYKIVDKGLTTIAVTGLDPMDLFTLLAEYVQTICGPSQYIGEVDDGTDDVTLGLNALEDAFNGSSSSWIRVGDGQVIINFSSTDTDAVTVNIYSGGEQIDGVDVSAGGTATWTSNITALGGKTLYLDRWRPGFLGLPGTGGGSLVLWVPKASEGGHLELNAQLNVS
ncbi:hypothetical protein BBO99_00008784 [Phytophthora kernoviae]|uniref:Uncharacterized protein n=2 Tax=Phytophthora kernoviae TaxID=325452 RepID=A0A3R7GAL4_9STRA|nr:hypothetical protein G195_010353 [Phytophthora kernoviae 00238/432]KAG2508755.1 hypothetical protein JM16_008683 [Phytophthora kernoviae]KAG2510969.1 hypothetical protein JM18_008740 [Phytophthora kernoviae]RLN46719.1 hypothetical protein BBI17_008887 [Phytophthora kernoviae]RLN74713.1 hypothetical protein BBO99_00008784 [Phytophthora kernoviae]